MERYQEYNLPRLTNALCIYCFIPNLCKRPVDVEVQASITFYVCWRFIHPSVQSLLLCPRMHCQKAGKFLANTTD